MASVRCTAFALFCIFAGARALTSEGTSVSAMKANPIRRVVAMLQMMSKKISEEGKKEKEQYDRFMCYCESGGGKLQKSITDAEAKIPMLESKIKETDAAVLQMKADVQQHEEDRAKAEKAIAENSALRGKEEQSFETYDAETSSNVKAVSGAIEAEEQGTVSSFLQTPHADVLRKIAVSADLEDSDRQLITSFLSQGNTPSSGAVTGILEEIKTNMDEDLKKAEDTEVEAKQSNEEIIVAKTSELQALDKMIEEKTQRIGEKGVEVVSMSDDLEGTKKSFADDQKFLGDMAKDCKTRKEEWTVREKLRSEEQLALADTIKILNDDDSLELFKKTLPGQSLVQLKASQSVVRRQARNALQAARKHDARLDLIALALHGNKANFDKVETMIDKMVKTLDEEQAADDEKQTYCTKEIESSEEEKQSKQRALSDHATRIEDQKEGIQSVTEEIAALKEGMKGLDEQVTEATEGRKETHATYVEELANSKAAAELLGIAKNHLNKFYHPEESAAAEGGVPADQAEEGGNAAAAEAGATGFAQRGPEPAPEMYGEYKKSGDEGNGVIGMLNTLLADIHKEMQDAEIEEKSDQVEYDDMIKDSNEKRKTDYKSLSDKEGAKADTEAALVSSEGDKKSKTAELTANEKYIHDLHSECDWLLSNHEVRKEARVGEIDSLKNGKAILEGADISFVQTKRHTFVR